LSPKLGIAVFVRKNHKILLGKRISKNHGDGAWSLPGGHLEKWESLEDCCSREVFEETGLSITNIRKITFTNEFFPESNLHYVTLFFSADFESGELINNEPEKCERWEWFGFSSLPAPLFNGIEEVLANNSIS
jgi:8-oxo-dGTP diphosphatase